MLQHFSNKWVLVKSKYTKNSSFLHGNSLHVSYRAVDYFMRVTDCMSNGTPTQANTKTKSKVKLN